MPLTSLGTLDMLRLVREIVANGSCDDLRFFLSSLGEDMRSKLFEAASLNPVEFSIQHFDCDRVSIFFEYGASPVQFGTSTTALSSPLSMALVAASRNNCLQILKLVVDEARARDCLDAAMAFTFSDEDSRWRFPLIDMCEADFAPALSLLFEAGLGAIERRPRISEFIAHQASARGATACLRRLHAHLPGHAWQTALLHRNVGRNVGILGTPLGDAFSHQHEVTFEYLLSFHCSNSADGADLLPRAVMEPALQSLATWLARPGHTQDQCFAEATRISRTWDVQSWAETCLVLRHAAGAHPHVYAAQRGYLRAAAALAECGLKPVEGAFRDAVGAAVNAPAADALLTLFTDAAAAQAHMHSLGAAVNSVQIRCDLAYDIDAIRRLFLCGAGAAARFLIAESVALGGRRFALSQRAESSLLSAISEPGNIIPSEDVLNARACLAACSSDSGELANHLSQSASELTLALAAGQPALAQLYLDHGADVFVRTTLAGRKTPVGVLELLSSTMKQVHTWLRPTAAQASALPAEADHAVAIRTNADFASLGPAEVRAHATAAAAEEERLLAAILRDPDLTAASRNRSSAVQTWAFTVSPALSLRWLWARMCERDAVRAREYLSFPGVHDTPLDAAVNARNPRCVRLLASFGARLSSKSAQKLISVCYAGMYELAWAMLDALPDDAGERALLLNSEGQHALAGVLRAPLAGFKLA